LPNLSAILLKLYDGCLGDVNEKVTGIFLMQLEEKKFKIKKSERTYSNGMFKKAFVNIAKDRIGLSS